MDKQTPSLAESLGGLAGTLLSTLLVWTFQAMMVQFFWNASLPSLFSLSNISYPQAFSVSALCSILFKPSLSRAPS